MAGEVTIPMLPCASIDTTLAFYVALGFEITYQQARPNTYGCVKCGDIDLHFFTLKGFEPANSYSSCIVLVEDADALHKAFVASLRQHYAKLPVAGIPRITKPNNKNSAGDYRFNVIDPGGNWIRFIQKASNAKEPTVESADSKSVSTKLSRATHAADLLANAKGDFPAAAKMLDAALAHDEKDVTSVQRMKALILRAEVAANMDDQALARNFVAQIRQLSLTDTEQISLADELQRVEELAQLLE